MKPDPSAPVANARMRPVYAKTAENRGASRRLALRTSLLSSGLLAIGNKPGFAQALPALPANPRDERGLRPILAPLAPSRLGALQAPDENGLRLPPGFSARVVARSGQPVGPNGYLWHGAPDGGGTFPAAHGGWIYVSNSELADGAGGASALAFDAHGNIQRAYRICSHSSRNCVGGATPWGTWLSAEEVDRGRVFECDPTGQQAPVARHALGWFDHEAIAYDNLNGYVYMTEDRSDGRLYRFRPTRRYDLSAGKLEVARKVGSNAPWKIEWLPVPNPNPSSKAPPTRSQAPGSSAFNGGEGIWYHANVVYFTTKGDNRVWALDTSNDLLSIVHEQNASKVDNITTNSSGELYLAEDGGEMQVLLIAAHGQMAPILQLVGHEGSEITGMAFSPNGSRLYFSSQRGSTGRPEDGVTYEVRGPFSLR